MFAHCNTDGHGLRMDAFLDLGQILVRSMSTYFLAIAASRRTVRASGGTRSTILECGALALTLASLSW